MHDLKILIWAINDSKELMESVTSQMQETADLFAIETKLFGLGKPFKSHKQRINLLYEFLQKEAPETIVVCMDGSDTLFNDSTDVLLHKFKEKKTRILISGEKGYSYQYPQFKEKFDLITSPYRYVNAGTFMGYAKDLLVMLEEMIELNNKFPKANDQGLLGIWVNRNLDEPGRIQIDESCDVFWVTTGDWLTLKEVSNTNKTIYNPYTKRKPVIIHNVGNNNARNNSCYQAAYQNIKNNQKKKPFQVGILSPAVPLNENNILPPEMRKYQSARVSIWDLFTHPYISAFYYGEEVHNGKAIIKTNYFQEAVYHIEETYLYDCIVHVPKNHVFYHDELYDFLKNEFRKLIREGLESQESPQWEAFIYYENRYYPINLVFTLKLNSNEEKQNYIDRASILSESRPLKQYQMQHGKFNLLSLGGWCGPAITLEKMGLRKAAYPFCVIHSTIDCLLGMLKGNQSLYYEEGSYTIMPHFDVHSLEMRQKLEARMERFFQLLKDKTPILFIRTIISNDYQGSFLKLLEFLQILKNDYGRENDRMLILLHDQGVYTAKLQMLQENVMLWSVTGEAGWHDNKNEIVRNSARAIEYCLEEKNWQFDEKQIRKLSIVNHQSREIQKYLFDSQLAKVAQQLKIINLEGVKSSFFQGAFYSIVNKEIVEPTHFVHRFQKLKKHLLTNIIRALLKEYSIPDMELFLCANEPDIVKFNFPILAYTRRKNETSSIHLVPLFNSNKRNQRKLGPITNWSSRRDEIIYYKSPEFFFKPFSQTVPSNIILAKEDILNTNAASEYRFIMSPFAQGSVYHYLDLYTKSCCVIKLVHKGNEYENAYSSYFKDNKHYLQVEYHEEDSPELLNSKINEIIEKSDCEKIAWKGHDLAKKFTTSHALSLFHQSIISYQKELEKYKTNIHVNQYKKVLRYTP